MSAERLNDDPLLEEAADWFLYHQSAPDDARLNAQIASWRGQSDRHEAAWRSIARAWDVSGVPLSALPLSALPLSAAPVARHRRPRRLLAVASALAACLLLVFSLVPSLSWQLRADHVTATGETRQVPLPDGSRAFLDSGSAVAIEFDQEQRRIRLLGGQAFFDVTPSSVPFSVTSGDLTATALGTGYVVGAVGQETVVAVRSGKVSVRIDGQEKSFQLGQGDRIRLSSTDGTIRHDRVAAADIAAWREHRLIVRGETLAQVAAAIGRHYKGLIWLRVPQDSGKRISGVFNTSDPSAALRAAALATGARVREVTPYLLVVEPE
ncbi:MAG: FecR domain-containing protein [Minwuia sp.]|nr:FecR domain-containing protein [Minwuia sp.]